MSPLPCALTLQGAQQSNPGGTTHQNNPLHWLPTCPGVGDLVCHHVGEGAVASQQCGRDKAAGRERHASRGPKRVRAVGRQLCSSRARGTTSAGVNKVTCTAEKKRNSGTRSDAADASLQAGNGTTQGAGLPAPCSRQAGVLHPAIREGGRQQQDVIDAPLIGAR